MKIKVMETPLEAVAAITADVDTRLLSKLEEHNRKIMILLRKALAVRLGTELPVGTKKYEEVHDKGSGLGGGEEAMLVHASMDWQKKVNKEKEVVGMSGSGGSTTGSNVSTAKVGTEEAKDTVDSLRAKISESRKRGEMFKDKLQVRMDKHVELETSTSDRVDEANDDWRQSSKKLEEAEAKLKALEEAAQAYVDACELEAQELQARISTHFLVEPALAAERTALEAAQATAASTLTGEELVASNDGFAAQVEVVNVRSTVAAQVEATLQAELATMKAAHKLEEEKFKLQGKDAKKEAREAHEHCESAQGTAVDCSACYDKARGAVLAIKTMMEEEKNSTEMNLAVMNDALDELLVTTSKKARPPTESVQQASVVIDTPGQGRIMNLLRKALALKNEDGVLYIDEGYLDLADTEDCVDLAKWLCGHARFRREEGTYMTESPLPNLLFTLMDKHKDIMFDGVPQSLLNEKNAFSIMYYATVNAKRDTPKKLRENENARVNLGRWPRETLVECVTRAANLVEEHHRLVKQSGEDHEGGGLRRVANSVAARVVNAHKNYDLLHGKLSDIVEEAGSSEHAVSVLLAASRLLTDLPGVAASQSRQNNNNNRRNKNNNGNNNGGAGNGGRNGNNNGGFGGSYGNNGNNNSFGGNYNNNGNNSNNGGGGGYDRRRNNGGRRNNKGLTQKFPGLAVMGKQFVLGGDKNVLKGQYGPCKTLLELKQYIANRVAGMSYDEREASQTTVFTKLMMSLANEYGFNPKNAEVIYMVAAFIVGYPLSTLNQGMQRKVIARSIPVALQQICLQHIPQEKFYMHRNYNHGGQGLEDPRKEEQQRRQIQQQHSFFGNGNNNGGFGGAGNGNGNNNSGFGGAGNGGGGFGGAASANGGFGNNGGANGSNNNYSDDWFGNGSNSNGNNNGANSNGSDGNAFGFVVKPKTENDWSRVGDEDGEANLARKLRHEQSREQQSRLEKQNNEQRQAQAKQTAIKEQAKFVEWNKMRAQQLQQNKWTESAEQAKLASQKFESGKMVKFERLEARLRTLEELQGDDM